MKNRTWTYSDLCVKILEFCEENGATLADMERLPSELSIAIEENNKRLEKNKPFEVFKENTTVIEHDTQQSPFAKNIAKKVEDAMNHLQK